MSQAETFSAHGTSHAKVCRMTYSHVPLKPVVGNFVGAARSQPEADNFLKADQHDILFQTRLLSDLRLGNILGSIKITSSESHRGLNLAVNL